MGRRIEWAARAAVGGILVLVGTAGRAPADDCGNEPVACGSPIVHTCYCGDTVRWNYTLTGTLTNRATGTSPCSTSTGLTIGNGVTLTAQSAAQIIGSGSGTGIVFSNTQGSTVTSPAGDWLKVSGFMVGVQLTNSSANNTVENFEILNNGSVSGAYGVDLRVGANANTIHNMYIHNNGDEGIHLGGGSSSNTLSDSLLENNTNQQIYLANSDSNQVINNITGGGTQASLRLSNAHHNTINGNQVQRLIIDSGSSFNSLDGNELNNGRLEFQQGQVNSTGPLVAAHDNVVTNLLVAGTASHCVIFKRETTSVATDPLPYNNRVSSARLLCTSGSENQEIASINAGAGTIGAQNRICASTCGSSVGERACVATTTADSDVSDPLNIIGPLESSPCP